MENRNIQGMPELEVHQLHQDEVYKDIIRVNEKYRINKQNKPIKEGRVCLVRANGHKSLAVLRGHQDSDLPQIRMDDYTRESRLDLKQGKTYQFEFEEVGLIGEWKWAWNSTEIRIPGYLSHSSNQFGSWRNRISSVGRKHRELALALLPLALTVRIAVW